MSEQLSFLGAVADRDRILQAMRENHKTYLTALRSFAREHALVHGSVTIDDVRDIIERRDFPMPNEIGADNRVFGAVFHRSEFTAVGSRLTRRETRVARSGPNSSFVTVYHLAEAAA